MKKVILSLTLMIAFTELLSQNNEKYRWASFGPLVYSAHAISGFGLGFGFDMKDSHHFKIRLAWMEEFILLSNRDPDMFGDAGLLYSHVFGREWFRVTASGGLGFLTGRKFLLEENTFPLKYRKEKIFAPSIPLELGMDFTGKSVGVGFSGFANINTNKSIAGIMFRVIFGKIRDKG